MFFRSDRSPMINFTERQVSKSIFRSDTAPMIVFQSDRSLIKNFPGRQVSVDEIYGATGLCTWIFRSDRSPISIFQSDRSLITHHQDGATGLRWWISWNKCSYLIEKLSLLMHFNERLPHSLISMSGILCSWVFRLDWYI